MLFNSFPFQSVPHILLLKIRGLFPVVLKETKKCGCIKCEFIWLGTKTILGFVLIDFKNSGSKLEKIDKILKNSKVAAEKW